MNFRPSNIWDQPHINFHGILKWKKETLVFSLPLKKSKLFLISFLQGSFWSRRNIGGKIVNDQNIFTAYYVSICVGDISILTIKGPIDNCSNMLISSWDDVYMWRSLCRSLSETVCLSETISVWLSVTNTYTYTRAHTHTHTRTHAHKITLTLMFAGKGRGCAYRGRALIEIKMNLGEKLEEGEETEKKFIPREEVLKLQPFLRRRKFR